MNFSAKCPDIKPVPGFWVVRYAQILTSMIISELNYYQRHIFEFSKSVLYEMNVNSLIFKYPLFNHSNYSFFHNENDFRALPLSLIHHNEITSKRDSFPLNTSYQSVTATAFVQNANFVVRLSRGEAELPQGPHILYSASQALSEGFLSLF